MTQLIISPTQCYYAACLRRALAVTRPRASDRDATIGRLPAWSGGHDISSHWQHPSSTSDAVMRATWHSCWFRLGSHADKPHGNHHASGSDVLGNGITETRTYSNDNLLTAINYSNTSLGDLTYTWDTNENKTSESISGTMSGYGFTQSGTVYDDEDRLTGYARSNSSLTQSWSLTSVGDWSSVTTNGTAQSRTHGPTHELLTAGGQTVNTDVKGNITLLPTALSSLASTALGMSWDFDNKLKSVDVGNDSSTDVEYKYDALGRRVARVGSSGSYVYVQSDQQTIADYGVGDAPSSPLYRYVYVSYIDEPVVRKGAGTGGTIHYYHRNQQYSITAVTTSAGAIAERYAYSAYGEPTICDASGSTLSSSAISNRYSYTGRVWDTTVGVYHFRARWMSPKTGRFWGRDPIGFKGSPWDLYESLDSKPLAMVDPYGECSLASIQAAVGLIQSYVYAYQSLPYVFPLHKNNPHQHCVWNCRMTRDRGVIFSATQSLLKEYIDDAFADLRDALQADGCWCYVPEALRDFAQDSADSAFQPSDYWDNGMGILCGSICNRQTSCEDCCSGVGSGVNTPEGPGTPRPFGPRSQFPHSMECQGDADLGNKFERRFALFDCCFR